MLLEKERLIFIHIPKCAGTSIEVFFTGKDWAEIDARTKHITSLVARDQAYGSELWAEYFKFSVVRNPWARFVSFYNLIRVVDPSVEFDEWIQRVCSPEGLNFHGLPLDRSMTQYLADENGDLMVDFVAKVETLDVDFPVILDRLGVANRSLPRVMVGHYEHDYRKWYTPQTQKLVGERYQEDVERFEYEF